MSLLSMNRRQMRESIVDRMADLAEYLFGARYAGSAVVALHLTAVVAIVYMIAVPRTLIPVAIGACLWLLILTAHLFFDGCLIVRVERKLLHDDQWYGFWTIPFGLMGSPTKKQRTMAYVSAGAFATIVTAWRLWGLGKIELFR